MELSCRRLDCKTRTPQTSVGFSWGLEKAWCGDPRGRIPAAQHQQIEGEPVIMTPDGGRLKDRIRYNIDEKRDRLLANQNQATLPDVSNSNSK